jgi:hypothetical protein
VGRFCRVVGAARAERLCVFAVAALPRWLLSLCVLRANYRPGLRRERRDTEGPARARPQPNSISPRRHGGAFAATDDSAGIEINQITFTRTRPVIPTNAPPCLCASVVKNLCVAQKIQDSNTEGKLKAQPMRFCGICVAGVARAGRDRLLPVSSAERLFHVIGLLTRLELLRVLLRIVGRSRHRLILLALDLRLAFARGLLVNVFLFLVR